ncbi:MAG: alkaline phosphatase family protein [Candidatus Pacebacteria bacterium]|nr:alkaline phosphatase family protein [Candidatus Paceibacterota bacterium]
MFNNTSFKEIEKAKFNRNNFVKPLSESYCFSNICDGIEDLLIGNTNSKLPRDVFGGFKNEYKNVVLFIIDGFGWSLFNKLHKQNLLPKELLEKSVISQMTAQFPSTTAAELTSIHTGMPVEETGIYEWFYYEKSVDAIISPLLFSLAPNKTRNSLLSENVDPKKIFPFKTFYEYLNKKNITSSVFTPQAYNPSVYNDTLLKGANGIWYENIEDGLNTLVKRINKEKNKSYNLFYFDKVDSMGHKTGPLSRDSVNEAANFISKVNKCLEQLTDKDKTLFIFTADHGQIKIDPKKTIYLNKLMPSLEKKLLKNKFNKPLIPAGGCRDMFLYIKPEHLDWCYKNLTLKLKKVAMVYKTEDLIKMGFWQKKLNISLLNERVGDIVIIPNKKNLVWWNNKEKQFTIKHIGHHGGLSSEEMLIPFICFEK